MRGMQARAFQSAGAQIQSPQVCLAKVTVREIDGGGIHFTQIDAAKIAAAKIAFLARFAAAIEFLGAPFAQQRVERIGRFARFSLCHGH